MANISGLCRSPRDLRATASSSSLRGHLLASHHMHTPMNHIVQAADWFNDGAAKDACNKAHKAYKKLTKARTRYLEAESSGDRSQLKEEAKKLKKAIKKLDEAISSDDLHADFRRDEKGGYAAKGARDLARITRKQNMPGSEPTATFYRAKLRLAFAMDVSLRLLDKQDGLFQEVSKLHDTMNRLGKKEKLNQKMMKKLSRPEFLVTCSGNYDAVIYSEDFFHDLLHDPYYVALLRPDYTAQRLSQVDTQTLQGLRSASG